MAKKAKHDPIQPKMIRRSSAYLLAGLSAVAAFLLAFSLAGLSQNSPRQAQQTASPASSSTTSEDQARAHVLSVEKLTREQPNNPDTWIHLGDAYFDAGQPQQAIEAYERGLAMSPNNTNARTDLGTVYRLAGQPKRAITQYNEALAVDPRHLNARLNKGIVLFFDLDKKQEAFEVWTTLLSIHPDAKASNGVPLREFMDQLSSQM